MVLSLGNKLITIPAHHQEKSSDESSVTRESGAVVGFGLLAFRPFQLFESWDDLCLEANHGTASMRFCAFLGFGKSLSGVVINRDGQTHVILPT